MAKQNFILRLRAVHSRTKVDAAQEKVACVADVEELNRIFARLLKSSLVSHFEPGDIELIDYVERSGGSVEKYCDNVTAREVNARAERVLAALGASTITDKELRDAISERFAKSHFLIPRGSLVAAVAMLVLAVVGVNWASVRKAVSVANASVATKQAQAAADEAVEAAKRAREALEDFQSKDALARLSELEAAVFLSVDERWDRAFTKLQEEDK